MPVVMNSGSRYLQPLGACRAQSVVIRALLLLGLFGMLGWLAAPQSAAAQTCTPVATAMSFGNVNPGIGADTTATLTVTCTGGLPRRDVMVCVDIATGSGGAGTSGPRYLTNGGVDFEFDIFTTSAYTTRYTNGVSSTNPSFNVTLDPSGNGSGVISLYGRVTSNQRRIPANTYTSTFGSPTQIRYGTKTGAWRDCGGPPPGTTGFSFTASAQVGDGCTVSTAPVAFPTVSSLTTAVDATGSVSVNCTSGVSYTVALNGGAQNAATATTRQMASGANRITYGLYRDAARRQGWFTTAGSTKIGTGTGSAQLLPVYGRVSPQATPTPGNYADTVVVTVTY
jgi:spore coat protein U-like protein